MTKNLMCGLPKGFHEYCGDKAQVHKNILDQFYANGKLFGYQLSYLSEVGFARTYMKFGSASRGRGYDFFDKGGNHLMLASDSLATCIRYYVGSTYVGKNLRMMSCVPVYRYRNKKFRRWNQLIYTCFQEADDINAFISLLVCADGFLKKFYKKLQYDISIYTIFEVASQYYNVSHEMMYDVLYRYYYKNNEEFEKEKEKECFEFVKNVEQIGNENPNYEQAFEKLEEKYFFLKESLAECRGIFHYLNKLQIDFKIVWHVYHAIEYSSGICFVVRSGKEKKLIADGGNYNWIVNNLNPSVTNCWSFACSLEAIEIQDTKAIDVVYAIKLDCTYIFWQEVLKELRKRHIAVHEIVATKKLSKITKSISKEFKVIIIGKKEEENKKISYDNVEIEMDCL